VTALNPHRRPGGTRPPPSGYPARRAGRGENASWRRLRLVGLASALLLILAGCAASPEASRVRGESGADVGNHGNPVELLAPPDRFERVYFDTPYDGPRIAKPDTSLS
jgi:hypothetical protein